MLPPIGGKPDHPSRVINESGMNLRPEDTDGWRDRSQTDPVGFPNIVVQMP